MLKRLPKAKVVAHALEEKRMAQLGLKIDKKLKDGEVFDIGKVHVKSIHSPGHTEGGCCYLVENQIFTGDTLFVGTCGRTDFPGGSNEDLYASLNRLKKMPRDLRVRPGHDYGSTPVSTIGHEIATNPALMAKSLTEFEDIP
jgi:glyoxylase-like metal-dependent hydrolase (beta-lactamase superfamily II)